MVAVQCEFEGCEKTFDNSNLETYLGLLKIHITAKAEKAKMMMMIIRILPTP